MCINMVPHCRPRQLPAKRPDHKRRIDAISRFRQDSVDSSTVRDLRGLNSHVEHEGLDDGSRNGEAAGVGAKADPDEADDEAKDDAEEGDEAVNDIARVWRTEEHGGDPNEREKAYQ